MTVRVIDQRAVKSDHLCLKDLFEGDTFEFLDHNGVPCRVGGEMRHGQQGTTGICRVCYRNSRYLVKPNRTARNDTYVYNLETGRIHRRDPNTPVAKVDVDIKILKSGTLPWGTPY